MLRVSVQWRRILLCRCLRPLATLLGLAIVDRSGWNEVRDELRRIDRHARSVGYRRRRRSGRRIQRSLARALEALDRL